MTSTWQSMPSSDQRVLFNAGQECMSATRILVAESVDDKFVERAGREPCPSCQWATRRTRQPPWDR